MPYRFRAVLKELEKKLAFANSTLSRTTGVKQRRTIEKQIQRLKELQTTVIRYRGEPDNVILTYELLQNPETYTLYENEQKSIARPPGHIQTLMDKDVTSGCPWIHIARIGHFTDRSMYVMDVDGIYYAVTGRDKEILKYVDDTLRASTSRCHVSVLPAWLGLIKSALVEFIGSVRDIQTKEHVLYVRAYLTMLALCGACDNDRDMFYYLMMFYEYCVSRSVSLERLQPSIVSNITKREWSYLEEMLDRVKTNPTKFWRRAPRAMRQLRNVFVELGPEFAM